MKTMGSRNERDVNCFPIFATYFHSCGRYYRIHLIEGMNSITGIYFLWPCWMLKDNWSYMIVGYIWSVLCLTIPDRPKGWYGHWIDIGGSHCSYRLPFILLPWIIVNITETNSSPNFLRLAWKASEGDLVSGANVIKTRKRVDFPQGEIGIPKNPLVLVRFISHKKASEFSPTLPGQHFVSNL